MNVDLTLRNRGFGGLRVLPVRMYAASPRVRGLRGLGDGTCQVPQPGVAMVYPPCPGYEGGGSPATSPGENYDLIPAVYHAPSDLETMENCQPAYGPADTACVNRNGARQIRNQAKLDAANRDVFVENCNDEWGAAADWARATGHAVPPNNCDFYSYGQTLPGTTGGDTDGWLPGGQDAAAAQVAAQAAADARVAAERAANAAGKPPAQPGGNSGSGGAAGGAKPPAGGSTQDKIANGFNQDNGLDDRAPADDDQTQKTGDDSASKPNSALLWVLGGVVLLTAAHAFMGQR